jgi:hypothetical protein
MKLTRSTYNQKPVQEKKTSTLSAAQKELYVYDYEAILQMGKNRGQTLGWVKKYDPSYYTWMENGDIIWEWGLITMKQDALSPKKETNQWKPLRTESGIWLCLQEYEQQTTPSIW